LERCAALLLYGCGPLPHSGVIEPNAAAGVASGPTNTVRCSGQRGTSIVRDCGVSIYQKITKTMEIPFDISNSPEIKKEFFLCWQSPKEGPENLMGEMIYFRSRVALPPGSFRFIETGEIRVDAGRKFILRP
jgi:hypothetical protein